MVAAAVTAPDVLALAVMPAAIQVRWAGTSRSVPAWAAELGDGWVFGDAAVGMPRCLDVVAVVSAPPPAGPGADPGTILTGIVRYAGAVVGAPPGAGTAVAVYPTWWNERRREWMSTAARQVAHNALLIPMAVAACRVARAEGVERYVVLEFSEDGVTAVSVSRGAPDGGFVVDRLARSPAVDAHDRAAPVPLEETIAAVSGSTAPDIVIVTGEPGEPAGATSFERIAGAIGGGVPVVPVAVTEMLAAVVGDGVPEPGTFEAPSTVPWLQEVRASAPEPVPAARHGRIVAGVLAVGALAALVVLLLPTLRPESGPESSHSVASDADTVEVDAVIVAPTGPGIASRPSRSARVDLGPAHLDLPEHWRLRAPEPAVPGRVELLPDSGPDRRIVIVHSVLADGMDERAVAAVLRERAGERSPVIRDLDSDTMFGDRRVIAYTEVPDEFSIVRWSVVVFPGLQVAVGCQFLDGEWTGLRAECEQAVHTLEIG